MEEHTIIITQVILEIPLTVLPLVSDKYVIHAILVKDEKESSKILTRHYMDKVIIE